MHERQQSSGKKKRSPGRTALFVIVLVICIGVFLFAGYQLAGILFDYGEGTKEYASISEQYSIPDPVVPSADADAAQEQPQSVLPKDIDIASLTSDYPDCVGWIYIEGTPIDYPIARAEDNSYYLRRLLTKEHNTAGTLFVDYRNTGTFADQNTIIYGHNMKNGSMFACLAEYRDPDYYAQHPAIWLFTPGGIYRAEIFSIYDTDAASNTYTFHFETEEDFAAYLERIVHNAEYDTGVAVAPTDRILTLSTCVRGSDTQRHIVHAKLVSIGD